MNGNYDKKIFRISTINQLRMETFKGYCLTNNLFDLSMKNNSNFYNQIDL